MLNKSLLEELCLEMHKRKESYELKELLDLCEHPDERESLQKVVDAGLLKVSPKDVQKPFFNAFAMVAIRPDGGRRGSFMGTRRERESWVALDDLRTALPSIAKLHPVGRGLALLAGQAWCDVGKPATVPAMPSPASPLPQHSTPASDCDVLMGPKEFAHWMEREHGADAAAVLGEFKRVGELPWLGACKAARGKYWRDKTVVAFRRNCHEAIKSPKPEKPKAELRSVGGRN